MSLLDLPEYNDYSLSLRETRIVYLHGELRLDKRELELTEQGFSVEQTAAQYQKVFEASVNKTTPADQPTFAL